MASLQETCRQEGAAARAGPLPPANMDVSLRDEGDQAGLTFLGHANSVYAACKSSQMAGYTERLLIDMERS